MGLLDRFRKQKTPVECAHCRQGVPSFRCAGCGLGSCAECARSRSQGTANGVKGIEYSGDLPEELRRKIEAGLQILTDRIKALVDREEWICLECSLKQAKPIVLKRM